MRTMADNHGGGGGDDHWSVSCSEDEGEPSNTDKDEFGAIPAEVFPLYEMLDAGKSFDITWNWPLGKRAPTDPTDELDDVDDEALETKPEEKSDFDFMDEASTPILRKGGKATGPKGSAKKKTTSFSGVLSNIRRHRQQERLEKEGRFGNRRVEKH